MILWFPTLLILVYVLIFEVVIYILYLVIKALKIYIKNNEKNDISNDKEVKKGINKTVKRFIICNILGLLLVIGISRIISYTTENVITCDSKSDVEEFEKILEKHNVNYIVLPGGTNVKLHNENDFTRAIDLIQDEGKGISFGYVTR